MATKIEAAELMVYRAAVLKDSGERHSREISMAKLYASEISNWVANQAVQIHGGYGYTMEYDIQRYVRDAMLLTTAGASIESLKARIAPKYGLL